MELEGKVAIVTGGSRGIGFSTVKAFVEQGASVVLCASRQETADKAVAQLKETYPDAKVEGIWPNLSSLADVQEAFDRVAEKYGSIDIPEGAPGRQISGDGEGVYTSEGKSEGNISIKVESGDIVIK